jgi:hypothetical protein
MGHALPKEKVSVEEFLDFERKALEKSELINGEIYAMTGTTRKHNRIAGNLFSYLHGLFKNKSCNIYFSDLRVQVEKTNLITYPDLVITCGEEILRDSYKDTILNPKCIIEVLSESTEKYDRGDKFSHYQKIESLEEYILVSQDTYKVESFLRSTKETWVYTCIEGLESVLAIQSIGGEVSLGVVYSDTDDL